MLLELSAVARALLCPCCLGFFGYGSGEGKIKLRVAQNKVHPFPWSYYRHKHTQSPVNRLQSQAIQVQFPAITGAVLESALAKALLLQN